MANHSADRSLRLPGLQRSLTSAIILVGLLSLTGCHLVSRSWLTPAGPIAAAQRHEFFIVSAVMLLVIGPVILLAPLIAWHYRLANTKHAFRPQWGFSWFLEGLIWIPPIIIVIILSVFLIDYTVKLDPYRPIKSAEPALNIQAVALDWKWLFIYPDQHIALVNQLVVPAGRPIHFSLTSGTVMQSLMMPQLAGQIYCMAGMVTQLNVEAKKPGTYWGENTQYNGTGFDKEKFQVHALTATDFAQWLTGAAQAPNILDEKTYHNLSQESVLPHPTGFGKVDPGIFMKIVRQLILPGYIAQHEDAKSNG